MVIGGYRKARRFPSRMASLRGGRALFDYNDLAEGIVSRGHLICPQHAWRFSTATGCNAEASEFCLVTYSVRVVGDQIEVDPRPRAAPASATRERSEP